MKDLEIIKKYYGENMAHLCRELFPGVLEKEGILSELILKIFHPNKLLYNDIVTLGEINCFKEYILSFLSDIPKKEIDTNKSAVELMNEAGYDLFECKTEKDIQQFRKYFREDEELCTFKVGNRLDNCYVFFAVKKDVDSIKREDFKTPKRQDRYGTSVISIQFSKGGNNILSIKNRYNHVVSNPDATFSNNLDNIIQGLTNAFKKDYNLNINVNNTDNSCDFDLDNYVQANDGKYYRYNVELNNIYYCPDNIIIKDFDVINTYKNAKERYIVFDYFILDLMAKRISTYDYRIDDCFHETIGKIEKVSVKKDGSNKIIYIQSKEYGIVKLVIDSQNNLTEYKNEKIAKIPYAFIVYNTMLKKIEIPNVNHIADDFLYCNRSLEELNIPNVITIGDNCLSFNEIINKIYLPKVKVIGNYFCRDNNVLEEINLPNVEVIAADFLLNNEIVNRISLPNVWYLGYSFLGSNTEATEIYLPKVREIGDNFMENNATINKVNFPTVKIIGQGFLRSNLNLNVLILPNVEVINSIFLPSNKSLKIFVAPNLKYIGEYYFVNNRTMKKNIRKMMDKSSDNKGKVLKLKK